MEQLRHLIWDYFGMNTSAKKINLRVSLSIAAVVLLSGCGLPGTGIDTTMAFDKTSQNAVIIGGADITKNTEFDSLQVFVQRYDPDTQKLIPDESSIVLADWAWHRGITIETVKPGYYAAVAFLYNPGNITHVINTPDLNAHGLEKGARIGGVKAHRFKIEPGEVVYIGEFVVDAFKPKWIDRRDEVEALLNEMPHVTAPVIFRPPTERTE